MCLGKTIGGCRDKRLPAGVSDIPVVTKGGFLSSAGHRFCACLSCHSKQTKLSGWPSRKHWPQHPNVRESYRKIKVFLSHKLIYYLLTCIYHNTVGRGRGLGSLFLFSQSSSLPDRPDRAETNFATISRLKRSVRLWRSGLQQIK